MVTEQLVTSFDDPRSFLDMPRLAGLELSPDGTRLVTTVSTLNRERTKFVTALWEVDPRGERAARRLTRGAQGEKGMAFTPDGDLLFLSTRPDPEVEPPKDEPPAALWLLPGAGGEARRLAGRPGGVGAPAVAAETGTILVASMTLPGAVTEADDERLRTARREQNISAILHAEYPIRYWDHDLGPDQPRLLVTDVTDPADGRQWQDLTPAPGHALRESHSEISPDAATVVTEWQLAQPHGDNRATVVAIDVATGARRPLLDEPEYEYGNPRISPDGTSVVAVREARPTPSTAVRMDLVLVPLAGGPARLLAAGWDRWPAEVRWTPDSRALIVTADQRGRCPLFRLELANDTDTDVVTQLTDDDAAYASPSVSPDGRWIYALRHAVDAPPTPVRLDAGAEGQRPTQLPGPAQSPRLPGTLAEVTATSADNTSLRGWLALPADAGDHPAPLLVWVHGGPLTSWNHWHWRWNPWLMVARGYAVLLPDPALSTGYGQAFVERGWGQWGGPPYTDLLTLTDAAQARPDIDGSRSALMGGSFGGYMANWVAGHTDRFDAIVTHASLWALDQFGPTTDAAHHWRHELTEQMALENSPHRHVEAISTPMLVIHGNRDYRVPISEALRLWYELLAQQPDPADQPHRFLYFPDENHWVLTPSHAVLWYQTVIAFLDHHLRGAQLQMPELLG
ncbi:MAG TPA: prolyl oligopeptidase family serine peptidase [Pseudonocardia sp.]|jgi:dipeptidyl aminopeptidase/acylaminoacyl peptidase|uniref:S9 family peptidase n=1 Tax=Pseudonocardia sp. TaxID=60912 RepID=UPI002F3E48EA